jgi:hypothetical protein
MVGSLSLCRSPFILLWGNLIQTEPSIGASHQSSAHLAKQFQRRRLLESINRVHLTFSLYANCQNRPCGKEFNTTAFVNLLICNVNVNIIPWRNLNMAINTEYSPWLLISATLYNKKIVISMLNCYCREHLNFFIAFCGLTSWLVLNTLHLLLSSCSGASIE